jgi:hypothetical protein
MRDLDARQVVAIGTAGPHLFTTSRDDRVRVVRLGADGPPPDLVVFPCGTDRLFEHVRSVVLPPPVRAAITSGVAGVVFDASTEGGRHKADRTDALHHTIAYLGASPLQCVYLTQDRQYKAEYDAHCDAIGWHAPVAVINDDYWVWRTLEEFEQNGEETYARRLAAFRARQARRPRRFMSMNRTMRPTKLLFLLRLMHDGLWDDGFISCGGFRPDNVPSGIRTDRKPKPTGAQLIERLPGFEDHVVRLMPLLDRLDQIGRVLLGVDPGCWNQFTAAEGAKATELSEYAESWFSVVADTEMRAAASRITEKVLKPLVNFHPAVVLGNAHALRLIRQLGFVTFDEIFDEAYDDRIDPRARFDMAYEQVVRACRASEAELRVREEAIAEKLMYNAWWGLTRLPTVYRRRRDVALMNAILLAVSRHEAAPDPYV